MFDIRPPFDVGDRYAATLCFIIPFLKHDLVALVRAIRRYAARQHRYGNAGEGAVNASRWYGLNFSKTK